jgi:cell division septal protein FtsQ
MSAAERTRTIGQQKAPKRPRLHPAIPSLIALALVVAALVAIVQGAFRVRRVVVVGANLPSSAIVQTAGITGRNIFRLRSDAVIQRLTTLPAIEVSRVSTSFPDTVTIYARMRQPYAAWRVGSTDDVLDDTGRIIAQVRATTLPVIGGSPGMPPPGFAVLQATRYAQAILPAAPDGALKGCRMDRKLGLVITGKSGWRAVIGSGGPRALVQRVATLATLLGAIAARSQRLGYADLRFSEPYFRARS